MVWICILAGLAMVFFGTLFLFYRMAFFYKDPNKTPLVEKTTLPPEDVHTRINQLAAQFQEAVYEDVSIRSHDGLTLTGRYYHTADNAPLLLQMHGYKGSSIRDFCGNWPIAQELGYNVLLVSQRAHGGSQGHTITFGIKEHLDCLSWAEYAARRFENTPIFLMGVSMGAATVLMASGLDLPAAVKGIVADCPYDSPAGILKKVLAKDIGLPEKLAYPLVRLSGKIFGGFDLEKCSPLEAVQKSKVPILLIHGEDDQLVPCDMSRNLHRTAPEIISLHTIPKSRHARNQVTDPALYRSILVPFLKNTVCTTEVVAALIWDSGKFMICQRPAHKARGLLWEFVGGKVEPGESKEAALIRECREELAVELDVGKVFMDVLHKYPDLTVHLTLFHATIAAGVPQKLEHNDIRWITPAQIPEYDFCPADVEILERMIAEYT